MIEQERQIEAPARSGFSGLAEAIGARNLIIAIVTMPLAFIAVVAASLILFGRPGAKTETVAEAVRSVPTGETLIQPPINPPPGAAPAMAASVNGPSPLVLPAGEDITAMALDGDRLALRVKGPSGGSIVVYDLAKGAETRRIRVLENPVSEDEL